jgi:hypothetical protein
MKNPLETVCLKLAKELIEIKFNVDILYIEFGEELGKKFNIITKDNPFETIVIKL